MDFTFLDPVRKTGFKKLEVTTEAGKVTRFRLITTPRKLGELIQGEMELRTEIQLTLGSDLLTYGLDKFFLVLKEVTGRGDKPVSSTLKYEVVRMKPEFTPAERRRTEKLYYKKVKAPLGKCLNALGPRVKKVRAFMKEPDQVVREEVREVAAKEIVDRVKKATADFGFDFDRISKRTGDLLGRMADILGESAPQQTETPEYQSVIRKKTSHRDVETKPHLIIIQQKGMLQILGVHELDAHFDDINPELLNDTLQRYLLTKMPKPTQTKEDDDIVIIGDNEKKE
ncbi:MAG: hypothetical protein LUQ65_15370 [Candidatus Helarchaeota archaeon]|nr:hypothetical protein [Candidatus Helarchaeota archaeon]